MTTGSTTSATAVFSLIEKQRQLFDSLYRPSVLQTTLEQYERMARPSALEMVMEQQERWRRLIKGPARPSTLQMVMEQQANIDRLMSSSISEQFTRQQRLFEELVAGPKIMRMLAGPERCRWGGSSR